MLLTVSNKTLGLWQLFKTRFAKYVALALSTVLLKIHKEF